MKQHVSKNLQAGFSLIEVMVATLILLVIVLMIGSIFRQSSSTWDSGYTRAEGGAIVRGVVGMMQRELSTAVDGRLFPGVWSSEDPVDVQGRTIKFICYKPADGNLRGGSNEEPRLVEFKWNGSSMERTERELVFQPHADDPEKSTWGTGANLPSSTIYEESDTDGKAYYKADFEFEAVSDFEGARVDGAVSGGYEKDETEDGEVFRDNVYWNVPYVSIKITLTRASRFSGIKAYSFGPDGEAGTKDDIVVE